MTEAEVSDPSNATSTRKLFSRYLTALYKELPRFSGKASHSQQQERVEAAALGFKGLTRKYEEEAFLEQLPGWDKLTDKQKTAEIFRSVYTCKITDIARRMGISRKTVDEHLAAAKRTLENCQQNSRRHKAARHAE